MVVETAEQDKVGEVGLTAVGPVLEMVSLGAMRRDPTAGEPACRVTGLQRQPLSRRNGTPRAADVQGCAVALGHRDQLFVAPDAAGDLPRPGWSLPRPASPNPAPPPTLAPLLPPPSPQPSR